MKKQIIAAAVAASVSAVALADVSISGAAQVNINKVDGTDQPTVTHDVDLKVVGKAGDTTFTVDLEDTAADASGATSLKVKNTYMNTSVAGMNLKVGKWFNGDSNLNNATQQGARAELSTDVGGASVKLAMEPENNLYEMHLGADLAGVKVNYEQENSANDSHKIISVGGSLAGVDFSFTDSRSDSTAGILNGKGTTDAAVKNTATTPVDVATTVRATKDLDKNNEQNMTISTNVGGMKVEYQKMKSKAGTTSDGFFGTFAEANLLEADGFGITTSLAGNTVQIRNYKTLVEQDADTSTAGHQDQLTANPSNGTDGSSTYEITPTTDASRTKRDTKIIVTRPLASGATAEFTYVTGDSASSMDLEFRMAF